MDTIYTLITATMTNYKDLFFASFIIVILLAFVFLFYLIHLIEKNLQKRYVDITMINGEKIQCTLYKVCKNGKVFKNKGKLIITDHTNVQIPCLELEMLYN